MSANTDNDILDDFGPAQAGSSIVPALFYELATGRILQTMSDTEVGVQTSFEADCDAALHGVMFIKANPTSNYVDTSTTPHSLKERQNPQAVCNKVLISPDGVDAAVISGLPDPCTLTVDGIETAVAGGSFSFTTTEADGHLIVLDEPTYARQFWQIVAQNIGV